MTSLNSTSGSDMRARLTRRWNVLMNRLANGLERSSHTEEISSGPTLRGKVMMVVLSTTCLALLLSSAALLIYELRAYRQSRLQDMQTQADIIARATAPALSFNDANAAAENLYMLRFRPQITGAAVYKSSGEVFATYLPTGSSGSMPSFALKEGYATTGQQIELYHPIRQNNELLGTLYLRSDNDIVGRLFDYLLILLAVMIASTAAAAFLTVRLQRSVTDPILAVAHVARNVMLQRDFSLRAPKTSTDEVGFLVDAFNNMLTEVAARTDALEQSNHHLSVEMAERRKAEEALKYAARKKDEFLATLAHELRNPLAPISNAAEILRRTDDPNSPLRQRALDIMSRQLKQMVRLIDDLLDVSRITTGKLLLHKERVDLTLVLQNALEIATPLLEYRRHTIEVNLPKEPVYIDADGTRLAQVFANMLNNAAKYTAEEGHVALSLRLTDTDALVSIKDNGIGIAPAYQKAVFDMFVQVDQSLDRGRSGLGVGLTLAKQLTALHGGDITVHSEGENLGTEFLVRLPLSSSLNPFPALPSTPTTVNNAPDSSLRILVADDNVDFATSLGQILESQGHQVTLAHDGQAALNMALVIQPQLVFLDIGMPHLNGYEVAERLRHQRSMKDAVLVAITGWNQDKDRERSRVSGINHHLAKPVDMAQLTPILQACQEGQAKAPAI